ncbi:MAG: phosphate starvation-inducible protein PhoH, partial [Bacteroidetes bacterium]|nr:phosphate starvation-inducible protein PhoH [Bacteroidota bacterium]
MVEKVITLENVSLIDFLGIENANIQELATAFPKSKIISRGNEIKIKGSTPEILKINEILVSLLQHYHKYGKITHQNVQIYIQKEEEVLLEPSFDDILL